MKPNELFQVIEKFKSNWRNRTSIQDTRESRNKERKNNDEKLKATIEALSSSLNALKKPLKAITELKKVAEGYIIEGKAVLDDNQLSIFDL